MRGVWGKEIKMAIVERSGLWRYLDGDGNEAILYPVTLADNVDGVGEPNGIAQLDENGKVPLEQLPEMASGDLGNEVSEVRQDLNDHTADTTAHVTAAEREEWGGKADADHTHTAADVGADAAGAAAAVKLVLDNHTADATVHITAAERAKWNNAAENPPASTAEDVGAIPAEKLEKLLQYGDEDGEAGMFDKLTTAPTETGNPLRYNGTFRATQVRGMYYSDDADLAERYAVEGEVKPGELVMICEDGVLRRNDKAANPRVLGIASTAPAMVLGNKQSGVPIALAGRVPVKIVGDVMAGDLLCGSSVAGALEVAGANAPRGSIVAQALESGEDGVITALVLRM